MDRINPGENGRVKKFKRQSMKKYVTIFFVLFSLQALAQEKYKITANDYNNNEVEMADIMRENGKIYVVVGVIIIIFVGITFYMYRLDKRLSQLEQEMDSEKALE